MRNFLLGVVTGVILFILGVIPPKTESLERRRTSNSCPALNAMAQLALVPMISSTYKKP